MGQTRCRLSEVMTSSVQTSWRQASLTTSVQNTRAVPQLILPQITLYLSERSHVERLLQISATSASPLTEIPLLLLENSQLVLLPNLLPSPGSPKATMVSDLCRPGILPLSAQWAQS